MVPYSHVLGNGDIVKILTSNSAKGPSRDWLKIVKSNQAKSKINQWFKKENKEENIIRGRDALEKGAKKMGLTLSQLLSPERLENILNRYNLLDWESVCAAVGHGSLRETQVINRLNDEYQSENGKTLSNDELIQQLTEMQSDAMETTRRKTKSKSGVIVKGAGDVAPRFSKCCTPVPGDEVIAYVTRGRGVSLHRTDCPNILCLDDLEKNRLIEAEWRIPENKGVGALFRAEIRLTCDDRIGLLMDISRILTNENMNVKSLNARSVKDLAIFNVGLNIASKEEFERVCNRLLKLPGVNDVERVSV
jgi:GTP pyrophosphokinase